MQKTILLTLADITNYYTRDVAIRENLADALRGKFDSNPYRLSRAGVLFEGKGGHREVFFQHRELFLRFSQACREAQQCFVECSYSYLDREKIDTIFIEVEWTSSGKRRNITASLVNEGGQKLIFNLP